MKNWSSLKGAVQTEALTNELKGNLFEFLIAKELAFDSGMEGKFLNSFYDEGKNDQWHMMKNYESWLKENNKDLYKKLPIYAKSVLEYIKSETPLLQSEPLKAISITGKEGSFHGRRDLAEGDILLEYTRKRRPIQLSIKLSKDKAYVNTKSGGIRSFLTKYFNQFDTSISDQEELNEFLGVSFQQMADEMYEWAGISEFVVSDSNSRDQFSKKWEEEGLPVLPGDLSEEARHILYNHYYRVIQKLYVYIRNYFDQDSTLFAQCLMPILGLGHNSVHRLICFHQSQKENEKLAFSYSNWEKIQSLVEHILFLPFNNIKSSFEMEVGDLLLQIRLKPMNKFTVSGLKVNCSIKSRL